ncbi:uncharacterized protein LOC144104424 isoform X1 [Amblyomma americanum]
MLTRKVEILADLRAGKLTKAEIAHKYQVRWVTLYGILKHGSNIDPMILRTASTPEEQHLLLAKKSKGLNSAGNEGSQEVPPRIAVLSFRPSRRLKKRRGQAAKKFKKLLSCSPAAVTKHVKHNSTHQIKTAKRTWKHCTENGAEGLLEIASRDTVSSQPRPMVKTRQTMEEKKTRKPGRTKNGMEGSQKKPHPVVTVDTVFTQTMSSTKKGSLHTFISITNGIDSTTQVIHRHQADKNIARQNAGPRKRGIQIKEKETTFKTNRGNGCGTALQWFQEQSTDLETTVNSPSQPPVQAFSPSCEINGYPAAHVSVQQNYKNESLQLLRPAKPGFVQPLVNQAPVHCK